MFTVVTFTNKVRAVMVFEIFEIRSYICCSHITIRLLICSCILFLLYNTKMFLIYHINSFKWELLISLLCKSQLTSMVN